MKAILGWLVRLAFSLIAFTVLVAVVAFMFRIARFVWRALA